MKPIRLSATHALGAVLGFFLILPLISTAQIVQPQLECEVFVVDSEGHSVVPGAKVLLSGPAERETETDAQGKCVVPDLPAGTYAVAAQFPGLEAAQFVTVKPGQVTQVPIQLKPSTVKSSVQVTASAPEVKPSSSDQSLQTIPEKVVRDAPNQNEKAEGVLPLVPGVVRGPDGHINMKGARVTQSGALVNSANATDPATGSPGLDLPIDVVASVQVISNPYDPQYGKLTGAVSTIDTKTSNYEKYHFSIQNIIPRLRVRDGTVMGIGGATPRMTVTGPLMKDRVAIMQSVEYRFIRTPVNSLPPDSRDTTLESVNSYTQLDLNLTNTQTATVSFSLYPQKLKYAGLNTFTPQPSTSDYHQRGYQVYAQHRYATGSSSMLTSQFSYKSFDVDINPFSSDPYRLLVETTEGGFFNRQARRSSRADWQETYDFAPRHFLGTHHWRAGLNYTHSSYDSEQTFLPVEIEGGSGTPVERITFSAPGRSSIEQNEESWWGSDQWSPVSRLTFDIGLRFDRDSITDSTHASPRAGFRLSLTGDGRTVLKGGAGVFYDRVPLMIASFPFLPSRTVSVLDTTGQVTGSTFYQNQIAGKLYNPRSTAWNLALSRQLLEGFTVQVGYEWRKTTDDFILAPLCQQSCILSLANRGEQSYREFQVRGRYQFRRQVINASYVHSRAYGDLNDFFQFYGNNPKSVVQADGQGRLAYDAPNRVLLWGDFQAPWKLNILPVYDIHTGFPYSVQNVVRDYVGPRNERRFPRFESLDLQVLRPLRIKHLKARAGFTVFNLLNHFNPRDVQTIAESPRFGEFFNNAWREYRGKFVIEF